jgi:hypothetical protein
VQALVLPVFGFVPCVAHFVDTYRNATRRPLSTLVLKQQKKS